MSSSISRHELNEGAAAVLKRGDAVEVRFYRWPDHAPPVEVWRQQR